MRRATINLSVALIAFLLGTAAAYSFSYFVTPENGANVIVVESPPMLPPEHPAVKAEPRNLSPKESEIISEAESFACQNGYTEQQCGTAGRIYFEPGENPDHAAAIWERRRGTLGGKAYGLVRERRGESTLWRVVFRYTERAKRDRQRVGCAWVWDERLYMVRVQHD